MTENKAEDHQPRADSGVQFLLAPWWRLLWLIGAIVWCIVLNINFISNGASNEWIGAVSVVPLLAFVVDVFLRDRRLRKARDEA